MRSAAASTSSTSLNLPLLQPPGLLRRGPRRHPRIEHVERHRASRERFVVESANVELVAQLLLRPLAQLEQLELPDLVPERLRGPRHVAVGLALHVGLVDT